MSNAEHKVIVHEVYKGIALVESKSVLIEFPDDLVLNPRDSVECSITIGSARRFSVDIIVTRKNDVEIVTRKDIETIIKSYTNTLSGLYSIKINELELSVRAWNVLDAMKVRTIGELIHLSAEDLIRTRNCGRKTVLDIEWALSLYGLQLHKGSNKPTHLRRLRDNGSVEQGAAHE